MIETAVPNNMHCHPRQGQMRVWMTKMLIESGFQGLVLEMPNTKPDALLTGKDAIEYGRIGDILLREYPAELRFTQVLTIQITERTTPDTIRRAWLLGVRVAKVYPRNVTTNSENGVVDYWKIYLALAEAQRLGMIVCFHAEHPSYDVEGLFKEARFIEILDAIRKEYPRLKMVIEHVSAAAMIEWVKKQDPRYVRATIAPQYLVLTIDDIIGYSERSGCLVRVHKACKPMPKFFVDRLAVQEAAFSDDIHFLYGGDDAPHSRSAKECDGSACGVFNTTAALPFLIREFRKRGVFHHYDDFTSYRAADYYGYPRTEKKLMFEEKPSVVPPDYLVDGTDERVVSLFAGETMDYQLVN